MIDPAVRFAITLRILSGASYIYMVMNFNVSACYVYQILHETVDSIFRKLETPGIPLDDENELRELSDRFCSSLSTANPLRSCVGELDYIAIEVINPKMTTFLENTTAGKACTASRYYIFLYKLATCAGRTHDLTDFAASALNQMMERRDDTRLLEWR